MKMFNTAHRWLFMYYKLFKTFFKNDTITVFFNLIAWFNAVNFSCLALLAKSRKTPISFVMAVRSKSTTRILIKFDI